jgi:hypothetical protein
MYVCSSYPGRLLNPCLLGDFGGSMIADEGILLRVDIF